MLTNNDKKSLDVLFINLLKLKETYTKLNKYIELEHEIIMRHDLQEMNEIVFKKKEVYLTIEKVAEKIRFILKENFSKKYITISSLLEFFFQEAFDVYKHEVYRVQNLHKDIKTMQSELNKKLRKNKVVVNKVLSNYQESLNFWKQLSSESELGYNSDGKKNKSENYTQLCFEA